MAEFTDASTGEKAYTKIDMEQAFKEGWWVKHREVMEKIGPETPHIKALLEFEANYLGKTPSQPAPSTH